MTTCRSSFALLLLLLVVLVSLFIESAVCDTNTNKSDGQLLSVLVIFRHGDRTPVKPYPTDPYSNSSFWPVGFGQLTNIGKEHEYDLGLWLRQRYKDFLPEEYSENDIYVRSTDVDRTLMSGEAVLAGLYPPVADQLWDQDLKWQPIPIHTVPEFEDPVLAMKKRCPKYDLLVKQLMKSDEIRKINHQLHDLYAYLTRYSGETVTDIFGLEYIYNTLFIEQLSNFTLPNWTHPIFPDKLKPWAALSFALDCYTKDMARLKTGPLFQQIQQHFINKTTPNITGPKFWIYSGHDMTVASVLKTMGAFENHSPSYAATVIFELRSYANGSYINVFYKNTTDPRNITVEGCNFDCPLEKFVELMGPITVTVQQWERECKLTLLAYLPFSDAENVILLVCAGMGVVLLLLFVALFAHSRKTKGEIYLRLPDNDTEA